VNLRKEFVIVASIIAGVLLISFYEPAPVRKMMDWRAKRNALSEQDIVTGNYEIYDHTDGRAPDITVDFLKGKHFWSPQVAIWLEDSSGNYIETLLVTTSTAKGLFYSGRSATNFKEADNAKEKEMTPTRRVDGLPYWSHKRGHRYEDGYYTPPPGEPLPDAITGATPSENFYFKSESESIGSLQSFRVRVEVNVAFDENEYYSEYDFADDSLYHGGTGLLGQPSLIYSAVVRKSDRNRYYVLSLDGHGHHSGSSGALYPETETITTAKYVVERIVIGVNESWYKH
jgi:hypothetical protein